MPPNSTAPSAPRTAAQRPVLRVSVLLTISALLLSGCATTGPADPRDPLQSVNRATYKFNDTLDRAVLKPVAQGYKYVVPQFARIGVRNFFSNLNDVTVTVNDLLQGKVTQGGHDAVRFTLNTTIGLLGFIDVATDAGFEKHNEDFGQTLGVWGVGPGPYLVLPLLGPSSVRDAFGILGDLPTSPYERFKHISVADRNEGLILSTTSTRAGLLGTEDLLYDASLSGDTYNFVRDAWLQRRQNQVYDGHPPPDPDDMLDDDPAAPAAPAAPAKPADPVSPSSAADPSLTTTVAPTASTDADVRTPPAATSAASPDMAADAAADPIRSYLLTDLSDSTPAAGEAAR